MSKFYKNLQSRPPPVGIPVKRLAKKKRFSSTPGRVKKGSPGCVATKTDRTMAKRSRSYRLPNYPAWCAKCDKLN